MGFFKRVILDGEDIGFTFCRSCAVRHVFYTLTTKRNMKGVTVATVKETLVETDTELQFRTPSCASKS